MPAIADEAIAGVTDEAGVALLDETIPPAPPTVPPRWRFCYATPQPAGGILGEFTQAQTRTVTLRAGAGNYHEAQVNINGRDLTAAAFTELQNDMVVLWGTQIVFLGRIAP